MAVVSAERAFQGNMFRAEGNALCRFRETVASYMLKAVFGIKLLQFRCSVVGWRLPSPIEKL